MGYIYKVLFSSSCHSKHFYTTGHIHPFRHTHIAHLNENSIKGLQSFFSITHKHTTMETSEAMWGSMSCPRTLQHAVRGNMRSKHRLSHWQTTFLRPDLHLPRCGTATVRDHVGPNQRGRGRGGEIFTYSSKGTNEPNSVSCDSKSLFISGYKIN